MSSAGSIYSQTSRASSLNLGPAFELPSGKNSFSGKKRFILVKNEEADIGPQTFS